MKDAVRRLNEEYGFKLTEKEIDIVRLREVRTGSNQLLEDTTVGIVRDALPSRRLLGRRIRRTLNDPYRKQSHGDGHDDEKCLRDVHSNLGVRYSFTWKSIDCAMMPFLSFRFVSDTTICIT